MRRRDMIGLATAALAMPAVARAGELARRAVRVAADADREGRAGRAIGLSRTRYKVLTRETGGALFVLLQTNTRRGGPTRHIHHAEDEFFMVLAGRYVVEVGDDRFVLEAGDSVLGPRGLPHAWAFAGTGEGKMLISFAPAGKMEAFFAARERYGFQPGQYARAEDAGLLRAYGMELVGPGIALDTL